MRLAIAPDRSVARDEQVGGRAELILERPGAAELHDFGAESAPICGSGLDRFAGADAHASQWLVAHGPAK
jgi:hypothetical protein